MLVLERKPTQSVLLRNRETGEEILIAVCKIKGQKAKIGTTASSVWEISRAAQGYRPCIIEPAPAVKQMHHHTCDCNDCNGMGGDR